MSSALKIGVHCELLSEVSTPDSGEPLAAGARVHVVSLEPLRVATKGNTTVATVSREALKSRKGRPCKVI